MHKPLTSHRIWAWASLMLIPAFIALALLTIERHTSSLVTILILLAGIGLGVYVHLVMTTRRKNALHELEMDRSGLIDLATHQLGMPLATFRWWLELLRDSEHSQDYNRKEICEQLQEGVDRMDQIITGLRSANKLQKDSVTMQPIAIPVASVITEAREGTHGQFTRRHQRLVIHVEHGLTTITVDPTFFPAALRELLDNASSYSDPHSTVELRISRGGCGKLRVDVEDHGCGIPAEEIPHLFQKFKRASNANIAKPVGSGLGLYVARMIVERSGGKIWLKSKVGTGTTISILLPHAV